MVEATLTIALAPDRMGPGSGSNGSPAAGAYAAAVPTAVPPPRVALIGAGPWGSNIGRTLAAIGALDAVADVDEGRAHAHAAECGVPVRSLSEILDDPHIHAVAVAVPAAQHAEVGLRVLDAGKHLFVEKPLALDVADAEKLVERAAAAGRILMVGHLYHYHAGFLALEQMVRDGRLGRLCYVHSTRLNLGRLRREENALWSFAPHDVSTMLRLMGSEPCSVTAMGGRFVRSDVHDITTTHLTFPGGAQGHIFVSWLNPYKEQRLVVIGDEGMAVLDDQQPWESKLVWYPHRIDRRDDAPILARGDGELVPVPAHEPLRTEMEAFISACRTGQPPPSNGAEGLRVLRVLAMADQSLSHTDEARAMTAETPASPSDVFVHESSYVDDGAVVGSGTRIWHFSHVQTGARIGRDCVIGQNVNVGPRAVVGDRCKIQNNVSLYTGVELGDDVFCGPSSVFTNVVNPRADVERKDEFRPTRVGQGASVGANATVVCGHDIGRYAFVAAGAVVTTDVPDHALVQGVPARQVGWVSRSGDRLGDDLSCPRSGEQYSLDGDGRLVLVEAAS